MVNTANSLAAAVVLLLVLFLCLGLARRGNGVRPDSTSRDRRRAFHAVAIRPAANPCSAAKMAYGKRYLSTEAPSIPLPGCDRGSCTCVYVHFEDRRAHQRRDVYLHRAYVEGERKQERRIRVGRRKADRLMLDAGG